MTEESIQVVVRFRPLNERETFGNIHIDKNLNIINVTDRNSKHDFKFDNVFEENSTQKEIYENVAQPAVESVCNGYNSTIFAYGSSGSGKTFSLFGNENDKGIVYMACETIFSSRSINTNLIETKVKCSFIEIYNERIRDLLNKVNEDLQIRQCDKGVYIQGLKETFVYEPQDIIDTINHGYKQRSVTSTTLNSMSSRSHAILTITISQIGIDGSEIISKLNIVDLAGSENVGKSEAQGLTLSEAQNINKSLSALGNVINALTEVGRDHIPYRDSKITYILQDSLGGNSKTIIIANVSPALNTISETLNTLKFAKRAKEIKNAPKLNKNESHGNLLKTIETLNKKIEILEHKLADSQSILSVMGISDNPHFNHISIFENRSNIWHTKLLCLEKEIIAERDRNKNIMELFEKQRKLCIDISKELIKERSNKKD